MRTVPSTGYRVAGLLLALLLFAGAGFAQVHTEVTLEDAQTVSGAKTFTGGVSSQGINNPFGLTVTNNTSGSTVVIYGIIANYSGGNSAISTVSTSTSNATLNNTLACSVNGTQPTGFTFYRLLGGSTQGKIGTAGTCSFNDAALAGDGKLPPNPNSTGTVAGREAIGAKLRRLAARAAASNPLNQIPLSAPPAWVNGTLYQTGNTVTNDTPTHVYQNGNSGGCTSAGSGGPTGTSLTAITDNNCTWYYAGTPNPSSASAVAPTVTNTTSTPGSTIAYTMNSNANDFFCGGGRAILVNSFSFQFWSTTVVSGGNGPVATQNMANTWFCRFDTDAPKVWIGGYCIPLQVTVDGALVAQGTPPQSCGGNPSYQVLDFGGARKKRSYLVQGYVSTTFYGVRVDTASKIWPSSNGDHVRAVFVGDSITSGGGCCPLGAGQDWPAQLGMLMGWDDIWNLGVGGTGYIVTNSGAAYNFLGHITDVTNNSPDLVFVFGGINDEVSNTPAQITAAALTFYQALRTAEPGVPIVVMGVWPGNSGPDATHLATEAAILSAFTSWNDPLSYFVPVANDPTGAWVSGTGKVSSTTGTGNADSCISSDGVHPTQLCISTIAQRVNTVFRQNILPLIP